MILAIVTFNIMHPGGVLVGPESELPGLRESLGWERGWKRGTEEGEGGVELVGKYAVLSFDRD
jgi:hypothetical protein